MSILTRPLLRQGLSGVRSIHATAPARSAHGDYHVCLLLSRCLKTRLKPCNVLLQHLPFKFPGDKKGRFGAKVFVFLFTGFSIPFLASAYQLYVTV